MYDLIVRNVRSLIADTWQQVDIFVSEGRIAAIGIGKESGRKTIDGEGAFCLPGAVDLHVHFNDPGRAHWEGFSTGSRAAAAGGITHVFDMPLNSIPSTTTSVALDAKCAAIHGKSYVDYSLWGGLVPGNVDDLLPLAEKGVAGFKGFMSPSGVDDFENASVQTLRDGMRIIAQTGKPLLVHAEDPKVLDAKRDAMTHFESAADWEESRPVEAEVSAVNTLIELAGETGCRVHVVHVSSGRVLQIINAAKAKGVSITCETCPHYLLLDAGEVEQVGAVAKCAPPIRKRLEVNALHDALTGGEIDTLGSDHSPSPPELKAGLGFCEAWGGIAGIQHGYLLVLDRFGLNDPAMASRLVSMACGRPAELMDIKTSGRLEVGCEANFTLIHVLPNKQVIQSNQLYQQHKASAYCGRESGLEVKATFLRGKKIFDCDSGFAEPTGRFHAFLWKA